MHVKSTKLYCCTPIRMTQVEKTDHTKCWGGRGGTGPSHTAGGDAKWHNHSGKQFPKNINM